MKKAKQVKNLEYIQEYLQNNPCVDCGNSNPIVLEFDHVRGEKICNVSSMVWKGYAFKTLLTEIAKCEIRCANCHKIKTNETRKNLPTKMTKHGLGVEVIWK